MKRLLATATLFVAATLTVPAQAQVRDIDWVDRLLYLDGVVQNDGAVPADGPVGLRFSIHNGGGTRLWDEEWSDLPSRSCSEADCRVVLTNGRFSVPLGRHEALDDVLHTPNPGVAIRFEVYDPDRAEWITMVGSFAIDPSARAIWSTGAGAFDTGSIDARGDLSVTGTVNLSNLIARSNVSTGAISGNSIDVDGAASAASVTVGNNLVSGGQISVGGELHFASSGAGDGGLIADEWDGIGTNSTSYLELGEGFSSVTVTGDAETPDGFSGLGTFLPSGGLRTPAWLWNRNNAVIHTDVISLGSSTTAAVNIDPRAWYCWVGGVSYSGCDFCESAYWNCDTFTSGTCSVDADCDGGNIGRCNGGQCHYVPMTTAYAYPRSTQWYVTAQMRGGNCSNRDVALVCMPNSMVNLVCPDGSSYLDNSCTDQITPGGTFGWYTSFTWLGSGGIWPNNWPGIFGRN